jgi:hypothetical protein
VNDSKGRRVAAAVLVLTLAVGLDARAEDKVSVHAEVVLASNQGDAIDPAQLVKMKEEFARSGIAYSSWVRKSEAKVTLARGQPQDVTLPDGRKAALALESIKDGSAFVRVSIPENPRRKLVDAVYQLGRQGSVFIRAGDHEGGVLILVLSPPDQKRSGRLPARTERQRGREAVPAAP